MADLFPESTDASEPPPEARPSVGWRVVLPAVAFLCGLAWDAFTLGRQITSADLLVLSAYLAGAAVILVLMGRNVEFRGSSKLNLALQFFFGGIFSSLVVLYFVSSGVAKTFMVVGGLAAMLVTNEFLGERYRRLSLSWAVFGACGVMILNFLLPHLLRSIQPAWFFVSLALAVGLVVVLQWVSHDKDAVVWPTLAIAALLAVFHLLNLIPPVPLVARATLVASEVSTSDGSWLVRGRSVRGSLLGPTTLVRSEGEPVYCFTSIFVPKGIRTTATHRWFRLDPGTREWNETDAISFPIVGGRKGGYRGYTMKRNAPDGHWIVVVESETGAAISSVQFRLRSDSDGKEKAFERRF